MSSVPRDGCQLWRGTVGYGEGRSREVLQQLQGQLEGHAERHVHQGHASSCNVSYRCIHTHTVLYYCRASTVNCISVALQLQYWLLFYTNFVIQILSYHYLLLLLFPQTVPDFSVASIQTRTDALLFFAIKDVYYVHCSCLQKAWAVNLSYVKQKKDRSRAMFVVEILGTRLYLGSNILSRQTVNICEITKTPLNM